MHPATIPPELQAAAPELGRRFAVILAGLATLIARAFLRHPRAALIMPLWRYLTHTARRFDRLMAHIAAGRLPRKSAPGRTRPPTEPGAAPRAAAFPNTPAWLVVDLKHEGAYFRGQIEALLAEPAAAQLLAAHPAAARLLRPLCHMLALDRPGPAKPPRPSTQNPRARPHLRHPALPAQSAKSTRTTAAPPGPGTSPPKEAEPDRPRPGIIFSLR